MNYQELLRGGGAAPTRAALIGVGQFGRTLVAQSRRIPALAVPVLCDRDTARARAALEAAGLAPEDIVVTDSPKSANIALARGQSVITPDPDIAVRLPVDVVVEATGDGEAGAANAAAAIAEGRHLVLVTKETDCVVGPLLARRAAAARVTLTQVDGDQPSLLLGLISWARTLGLAISCAGKASEHDLVWDPEAGEIRAAGLDDAAPGDASLWDAGPDGLAALVRRRAEALAAIPQRTPPDYCEMCLVANGSGLRPDRPELHAAIARPVELADLYRGRRHGGLLDGENRLDVFNCFRRRGEISFAGGVFAVLGVPDAETGGLFAEKGIPVSADGAHALVYNPTHLLGVEAPVSILAAHRLGMATGASDIRPVCDVTMRATQDLPAGHVLADEGHHHRITGIEALLTDYAPLGPAAPVPYFMGLNGRLAREVRRGEVITVGHMERATDGVLGRLRTEQDATIAG